MLRDKPKLTPNLNSALPNYPKSVEKVHARKIVLTSVMSSRLKLILNSVIFLEQQCGLPNKQIFNNHLNILSCTNYTNDFIQPLAVLQIVFYEAFAFHIPRIHSLHSLKIRTSSYSSKLDSNVSL